ncbi:MAG: hypothetical protein RLZZ156_1107 [Deinococcota bacterium]|jgi:hypothetical protein
MKPNQQILLKARKDYSSCAGLLEKQITQVGLTEKLNDQIIGIGIAADWLRKAAEMESIRYLGDTLNESKRKSSFIEIMRFSFSWFALNALFSRDEIVMFFSTKYEKSEFENFKQLFNASGMTQTRRGYFEKELHTLLQQITSPRLPNEPSGKSVTVLYALNQKYVPKNAKNYSTAKKINDAAATNSLTSLDLPTLIYAFRNWAVHGNALDGAFGGKPRFEKYIELINCALGEIHVGIANNLLQKIK